MGEANTRTDADGKKVLFVGDSRASATSMGGKKVSASHTPSCESGTYADIVVGDETKVGTVQAIAMANGKESLLVEWINEDRFTQ